MKNKTLVEKSLLIALTAVLVIISIIYLAKSFYFENDGWGTSVEFDNDCIAMLGISGALLAYSILNLVADYKKIDMNYAYLGCFGVVAALTSFYPLGRFFRGLAKGKAFGDVQNYLYVGIFGLVLVAYVVIKCLVPAKEEK